MKNGYKKYFFLFLFLAGITSLLFSVSFRAQAATGILKQINFQGKVVNTNGTNVANGSYTFVFSLYTVSSGGANVWTESKSLTVTDGIFQTNLGDTTTLPGSVDFNTDNIYLGINFNSDGEMSPRVRFTAAPYALNALKVGGLTVTDTTGTLMIPNSKTISFGDAFTTTGAFPLTLTSTASTTATLPSGTITLADLTTSQTLTNKIIGSTGLTFTGATTDITTGTNEDLIVMANGSGVVDIQDVTTVDSLVTDTGGVNIAAGQSYTGAGAVTLSSAATTALTVDSGTTGALNLGTSNNAKTISLGTGTAGNIINIGTNNTTSDTITIGSALDNVAITGDQWSITDAGVLTVVSCSGCGGGATLDSAYTSGNTITTDSGNNVAITLQEVVTPTSFVIENQDTAGVNAERIFNSIASGTLTNGLLIEQTGAGTMTNGIQIAETAGTITDGILITGTLGNILNTPTLDITGAGAITGATGFNGLVITANTGVVTTGTWNATAIGAQYGGTGINTSASTGVPSISSGTWSVNAQLSMSLGGTNKNMTASNGAIVYSDADSFELSAAGTAGQALISGGAGTPTWFAPTAGSILFAGTSGILQQDNASFFFDDTNNRLGLGTTAPASMLDIYGTSNALRLSYDGSNYATLSSTSDGTLSFTSSNVTEAQYIINNGSAVDTSVAFDGASQDYYAGLDETTGYFAIGTGFTVGASTLLAIDSTGNVGIGTGITAPGARLDLSKTSTNTTAATEYAFRNIFSDTGIVTTGTDTTYGDSIAVTRTGATGGTINTYGQNITVTADNAGAGTSTATGLSINVSGADTSNGIVSNGTITFSGLSAGGVVSAAAGTGILSVGTIGAASITPDSLDFTEFVDSMTLDANLTIAQSTNTWTQNFTGTTTTGLTYNANSLTSGSALAIASTASALTGNLSSITLSGSNAANTGSLLSLQNTGTANANTSLLIQHNATGTGNLAFRVNDVAGDTTPFVIDGAGNVGIGTAAPTTLFELYGSGADIVSTLTVADATYDPIMKFRTGASPAIQFSLGVDNSDAGKFKIYSGDGLGGGDEFTIDSNGVTTIANLNLGATTFDEDAGAVTWVDMSVTSGATVGTVERYTAQLDGNAMLTIYGTSDGAGSVANLGVGIMDTTPDGALDFDQTSTSTTAATTYGANFTVSDTGIVTTGTDTTYGNYTAVTRTGATGGTINTYGQYTVLTTDNAGSGTSTAYGSYIDTGTAGATNADTVYGLYINTEANAGTAYGLYVDVGAQAGTEYAGAFMNGNVGIGDATPDNPFEITSTSQQLRLSYTDGSVDGVVFVDSNEYLILAAGTTSEINRVQIGAGGAGNATPDFFGLDVKSDTGDPAGGFEGALYYNTFDNKFRCYQGSAWTDCIGSGGSSDLQTIYGNDADGSDTTISLTAADDGLVFTNPTSGGNDLSAFLLQLNQANTTATVVSLDLIQASNAANGMNITANAIDGETGLAVTANGLTSGSGMTVNSNSTAFTGSLAGVTLSGSNVANTGKVFAVSNTGSLNTNVTFFVNHEATGTNNLAVRVDDVSGDTTPFVIDGTGKVGVGTTAPARAMDIVEAASAPQLRLSKDLTNYSEMTVDSVGDLEMHATGNDIRALTDNVWVCDGGACPALTLTGQGNIFIENVLKFGNGVYLKNDSATELGVYDNGDNLMLIFDEL